MQDKQKQRNKKLKYVGGGHVISLILNVHNLLSWLRKCPTGTCKSWSYGWEDGSYAEQDNIWTCECGKMSEGQCVEGENSREVKTKLCRSATLRKNREVGKHQEIQETK